MICPAPCRQKIRGANKVCVHGVWKHKRCPRTVWQREEIDAARREARRLAIKLGFKQP